MKWIDAAGLFSTSVARSRQRLSKLRRIPEVAVVNVGDREAEWQKRSQSFARKVASDLGVRWREKKLGSDARGNEIVAAINALNHDLDVTGIILSRPFRNRTAHEMRLFHETVHPNKDVEGMHPTSIGRIVSYSRSNEQINPFMWPLTARAAVELCASVIELEGMEALVIGSSDVVAKPVCSILQTRGATVTVCPASSPKLSVLTRSADAVFSAQGSSDFAIEGEMLKPGCVLIDLGFRIDEQDTINGDVGSISSVASVAGNAASIKHGIALLRTAYLFENLATAAEDQAKQHHI